jgi:class 3 adenylate cyclase
MAMKMKSINYNEPAKQILAIPDHYVALGYRHAKATALLPGNAVLEDGRYIVKAGTIYPANDATAIGVILNDYDVTDGDAMMAVFPRPFSATRTVSCGCKSTTQAAKQRKLRSVGGLAGVCSAGSWS